MFISPIDLVIVLAAVGFGGFYCWAQQRGLLTAGQRPGDPGARVRWGSFFWRTRRAACIVWPAPEFVRGPDAFGQGRDRSVGRGTGIAEGDGADEGNGPAGIAPAAADAGLGA